MANLPGVVLAAHRDGLLGHEEAPAMAIISLTSITAGGSLGPEAPLVSIGGGLASFVSLYVDLSEAETLFVTMCGMGAGLGTSTRGPHRTLAHTLAHSRGRTLSSKGSSHDPHIAITPCSFSCLLRRTSRRRPVCMRGKPPATASDDSSPSLTTLPPAPNDHLLP